ncbi:hypothetical protein G4G27_00280 [Sphingomonas sp. So64.6b]|uniref:hypothetical protein n=1 Tax=Sphingomonas sp. So64.6b TaxID=2997354 RepID=UPI001600D58F|nr:hypothetical protein [Sphingomonas sp. So64.6b]QNA82617.1 hypothetical protein G4G27_00280 [Sphingomonas sp. So64.6b]
MNKLVALCAGAMMLGAQPAIAQTFTPAGTYVVTGPVTVVKGLTLNCTLKLTVVVPSTPSTSASTTPVLQAGNILCPTVTFSATPYATSYTPATATTGTLTLSGVVVNTITPGGCSGTISGAWNNTTKKLVVSASLPGGGGSAPCTVNGTLTAPATLDIH